MKKRIVKRKIWWTLAGISIVAVSVWRLLVRYKKKTPLSTVGSIYIENIENDEVITTTVDLSGQAPQGAKFAINVTNSDTYFVNSAGCWQLTNDTNTPQVSTSGAQVEILATYQPPQIGNAQTHTEDVPMTGLLLQNHYHLSVKTPLNNLQGVTISLSHVADGVARVIIVNETGSMLTLPQLTISALKLN